MREAGFCFFISSGYQYFRDFADNGRCHKKLLSAGKNE